MRYRVSGHFSVGGLEIPAGALREQRVAYVEEILREGLEKCTTIQEYVVARQMRPVNVTKAEPDLVEEVTIEGDDREAVFTTYRNDPGHLEMVTRLAAIPWLVWSTVVYQVF
jgi:hypothetical protein